MALDRAQMLGIAAARWTRKTKRGPRDRPISWWEHPGIVRHVNKSICGTAVEGLGAGDVHLLQRRVPGRVFDRAISVGCGNGGKEVTLLAAGLVSHFDLYEISEARVEQGQEVAERFGVGERISWHTRTADLTGSTLDGAYDLVYWNNALHHMLDVDEAVRWTKRALRPDGYVYMNDFVGPNRMQWPDEALAIASRARELLPRRLLKRPAGEGYLPSTIERPDPDKLAAADPTECADSDDILPAIRRHFPAAWIKPTGGTVYHTALHKIIANFTEEDAPLLETLLLLDDVCTMAGHTHYAVALAAVDAVGH